MITILKMRKYLFLMLLVTNNSYGQLVWESKTLEFKPDKGIETIDAVYNFKNSGNKAVRIIETKSSCGCTTAKFDKEVYAPGEKGTISSTFTVGTMQGIQNKKIIVMTDYSDDPVTTLNFRVYLPELVIIENQRLVWKVGEKLEPKLSKIKIGQVEPISISNAESTNQNFFPKLTTVVADKEYTVSVKPTSTERPMKSSIRLELVSNGKTSFAYIYALVVSEDNIAGK